MVGTELCELKCIYTQIQKLRAQANFHLNPFPPTSSTPYNFAFNAQGQEGLSDQVTIATMTGDWELSMTLLEDCSECALSTEMLVVHGRTCAAYKP